jgi:predicted alpha/beta-fold hydrolase
MPTTSSSYRAPWYLSNAHVQTIYAGSMRKVAIPPYTRERLETPDGDFLDVDWLKKADNERVVIVTHGMCGDTYRPHVMGLVNAFFDIGYDVAALNFRGASGEPNRLFRNYHTGETNDLRFVIQQIIHKNKYNSISLSGYSLGGNVILKYLGEEGESVHPIIKRAAVVSVPCDLVGCDSMMEKWSNRHYLMTFNKGLRVLLAPKAERYPDLLSLKALEKANTFQKFANLYITKAFGFKDADDYHTRASSLPYLEKIKVPTLLLQAKNDPILSESCYPYTIAEKHPYLTMEVAKNGGHVGFVRLQKDGFSWAELRLRAFVDGKV